MNIKIATLIALMLFAGMATAADVYEGESIQAAINNATSGETIFVGPGRYIENVIVNVSLTLTGDDAIIEALNCSRHTISINANDTLIGGFGVTGATINRSGVFINRSMNVTIRNNEVYGNKYGIYTQNGSHNHILRNIVDDNTQYNIDLVNSTDTLIEGNSASGGWYCGIAMYQSCNNTVRNNTANQNSLCAGVLLYSKCYDNLIEDNTINNNNEYGGVLMFQGCGNNTVRNNDVCDNYGIYGGITLYNCDHGNVITGNKVLNNEPYGMAFPSSGGNLIYNNVLVNADNTYGYGGVNTWNVTTIDGWNIVGGQSIGGNYWSDYNGTDTDMDGFGDLPHPVDSNMAQYDQHPIMQPLCGDVDWNNHISVNDVIEVYRKAVDPDYPISPLVADVDSNTYISVNDVIEIYRKAVNPDHELHCGLNT